MERNVEEEKRIEEAIAKAKKLLEDRNKDSCPGCGTMVVEFPYMVVDPVRGWIECSNCGVVFSPESLREIKKEKSKSRIVTP